MHTFIEIKFDYQTDPERSREVGEINLGSSWPLLPESFVFFVALSHGFLLTNCNSKTKQIRNNVKGNLNFGPYMSYQRAILCLEILAF
jgi:hypothetical protein